MTQNIFKISVFTFAASFLAANLCYAQDSQIIVTARKLDPIGKSPIYSVTQIDETKFQQSPFLRTDDTLRQIAGFSLYRRSNSITAHPTSQGTSLRGIGPNGAGRTLVLLDDVPLNDPFGNWVLWARVPSFSIANAQIIEGGSAGAWGNGAMAGTISLNSKSPIENERLLNLSYGSNESYSANGIINQNLGDFKIQAFGNYFKTDGDYLIAENQRGPVDIVSNNEQSQYGLSISHNISETWQISAKASHFEEDKHNGTQKLVNGTNIDDISIRIVRDNGEDDWGLHASFWAIDENFYSTFTSISADRKTETLSLNQFAVPVKAYGAMAKYDLPINRNLLLSAGGDWRQAEGETNEYFTFTNNAFTKLRRAGGKQELGGVFVSVNYSPAPKLFLSAELRKDFWQLSQGHRIESVLATNAKTIDENYPNKNGDLNLWRLGARYEATPNLNFRVAAYTSYRAPSLNELYRPFRIGNDITEANANLRQERLQGGEISIGWQAPSRTNINATYFYAEVEDAIGNITIANGPGTFLAPLNIFVPAGGTLAQRMNIPKLHSQGLEFKITQDFGENTQFGLNCVLLDAQIDIAPTPSNIAGKRLAQVPKTQCNWQVSTKIGDKISLSAYLNQSSSQFDDDLNLYRLDSFKTAALHIGYSFNKNWESYFNITNIGNDIIQTARSSSNIISIAEGRKFEIGLRVKF